MKHLQLLKKSYMTMKWVTEHRAAILFFFNCQIRSPFAFNLTKVTPFSQLVFAFWAILLIHYRAYPEMILGLINNKNSRGCWRFSSASLYVCPNKRSELDFCRLAKLETYRYYNQCISVLGCRLSPFLFLGSSLVPCFIGVASTSNYEGERCIATD